MGQSQAACHTRHRRFKMPPVSTNVLILLVLGSAIALPDLMRTARQVVFEGFPSGLPDLTPLGVKLSLEAMFGPAGEMSAIPGEAGVDYPVYNQVPDTGFDCRSQTYPGFYTDPQADCQSFYIALLEETRPPSCVQMAQFSTNSTSCVTGGTTLTVRTNLLSTTSTLSSTRNLRRTSRDRDVVSR